MRNKSAVYLSSTKTLLRYLFCKLSYKLQEDRMSVLRVHKQLPNIFHFGFSISQRVMSSAAGPVESAIRDKLQRALEATHLEIINESHMHNVPPGSETHFKVVVVSNKFEGLQLIKRHRLVNDALRDEIQTNVHALSIVAKTPEQWETSDKVVESSPNCRGGFGK